MKEFGTREEEDAGERGAAAVAARAERGAAAVAAQDEEKWQSNCKVVYDAMMAAINSILAKNPQVNLTQPTLDRMDGVTKSAAAVDQVRAEVEAAKIIALDLARGKNREAHRLFGARKLAERMGAPTFLLQIGDRMASWISPAKNPTLRAEQWGELEPGWVEVWPRPGSGETKIIYRWEGSPTGKPETYVRPVAKKSVVPVRKPGGTRRRKSNRKRLTRRNR